jgi:hypothetical protein
VRWLLVFVASFSIGCSSTRHETVRKTIAIGSTPPGAQISMSNHRREISLGNAPATAEVELVTEYVDFNPWSLVLAGTWCGGAAGLLYLGTQDSSGSAGKPLSLIGGVGSAIVCFFTGMDSLITAIDHGDRGDTRYRLGPPIFTAELPGYETAKIEVQRDETSIEAPLAFHLKRAPAKASELPALNEADRPVLAVFEMTGTQSSTTTLLLEQITEYLATRLAETGRFRIVPREQIRRVLLEQKRASYEECIDESCQIELGKAVAAQLSLRSQLIHIGNECALSATMYDLKLEVTSAGALVRTACTADKLLDGADVVVKKLTQ